MADIPLQAPDAGQVAAITNETLHTVAGLAPAAQVAAVLMLGAVALMFLWTRRPQAAANAETISIVVKAMEEQSRSTAELNGTVGRVFTLVEQVVEKVDQVLEQNAEIIAVQIGNLPRR